MKTNTIKIDIRKYDICESDFDLISEEIGYQVNQKLFVKPDDTQHNADIYIKYKDVIDKFANETYDKMMHEFAQHIIDSTPPLNIAGGCGNKPSNPLDSIIKGDTITITDLENNLDKSKFKVTSVNKGDFGNIGLQLDKTEEII